MFNRDNDSTKRAMKGVRNTSEIDHDSYLHTLYSNSTNYASDIRMNFIKKYGTMAILETRKRALNSVFTKMRVLDDSVTILPLQQNNELL